jgi:hypothetical protein
MVQIQPFPVTFSILRKFTQDDGANIIQIVKNDKDYIKNNYGVTQTYVANGFLTSLATYFEGDSLPKSALPQYNTTDDESTRTLKTLNQVWGPATPKFYAKLWLSDRLAPTASQWVPWAKYSLINNEGYPYTIDEPLNLLTRGLTEPFQENYSIGISIVDAGWGYVKSMDTLVVKGCWTQDNRIIQPDPVQQVLVTGGTVQNITAYRNVLAGNVGTTRRNILPANSKRIFASVRNAATTGTIYVAYRDITPSASNNDGAIPAGNTLQVTSTYLGDIYAVASAAGTSYETTENYNA